MAAFAPITLQVMDHNGNILFKSIVPYEFEITAHQVLERAFVIEQNSSLPDPFIFTQRYYGYSQVAEYPGYLGYEIESICGYANETNFYWDLIVDGVSSSIGADSTYPNPGGSVSWQYTGVTEANALSARAAILTKRRK